MSESCQNGEGPWASLQIIPDKVPYVIYKDQRWPYHRQTGFYRNEKSANRIRTRYLHRQIWTDFYGIDPGRTRIYHIDGDRSNNLISNLAIETSDAGKRAVREIRERKKIQPAKHAQVCGVCRKMFMSKYASKMFCSLRCGNAYYRAQ